MIPQWPEQYVAERQQALFAEVAHDRLVRAARGTRPPRGQRARTWLRRSVLLLSARLTRHHTVVPQACC